MKNVISIQSHVVYGYVGNKSAVLPMQLLGIDVWPFNTVQFSNHTQLKQWTGMVIPDQQIEELCNGLDNLNLLGKCDAILSGYIGSSKQGEYILEVVKRVKQQNPQAIYLCDPVMSSPAKGKFVENSIVGFFSEDAVKLADYLTPNLNELAILSNTQINTFDDVITALEILLKKGVKKIIVKHLSHAAKVSGAFEMLMANSEGIWYTKRPLYDCVNKYPVGVGDLISAIFLANVVNGKQDTQAFAYVNNAVSDVMEYTAKSKQFEIQIVAARNFIAKPKSNYPIEKIK